MSKSSFAQRLHVSGNLPRLGAANRAPVRIGFLAPLSGPEEPWGRPGLQGCQIWADWINKSGGVLVAGKRQRIEIVAHDSACGTRAALVRARDLVETQRVRLVMTLGGDSFAPVSTYLMAQKILTSTLLPSDMSPDTPYLIAPTEVHPLYNVTGVAWLAAAAPAARRVALCSQTDRTGLPSLATYRAAFAAAGRQIVAEIQYPPDALNADEIVTTLMAGAPDILCWCTSAPAMVHALTEAAHARGFAGRILSCTADNYARLIARTSESFMDGFVFQFPDFDDPMLAETAFFFHRPHAFFDTYNARFPGSWSAVSWEYAAVLDLWHAAVQQADTTDPVSVLAAMKRRGQMMHAFGPASWWGEEFFGLANALVGSWPVVTIRQGKARIAAFVSVLDWLAQHGPLLERHMTDLGQMWHQRMRLPA